MTKMSLRKIFNKGSFIDTYLENCMVCETSQDFDIWCALFALSMIVNRSVMINRPNSPLYPSLFLLFIDENNEANRQKSIDYCDELLMLILEAKDNIHFIGDEISKNDIDYFLKKSSDLDNKCLVEYISRDLSNMVKNKYLFNKIIDLFDNPNERKYYAAKFNGNYNLRNVFINCLTNSTSDNFHKVLKKVENEDDIFSKFIIVYGKKGKRRCPWRFELTDNRRLVEEGKYIKKSVSIKQRTINLSPEAIKRYTGWYNKRQLGSSFYIKKFTQFEPDLILKLAALFAINNKEEEITKDYIENAIYFVNHYKKEANNFIKNETTDDNNTELFKTILKVRDGIINSGPNGIRHRDLYMKVHHRCNLDTYKYIISIMHELNMIDILQPYGTKTYIYRATDNISKIDIDNVMNKFID